MINEVGINDKCGGYLRLIPLVLLLVPPTLLLVPPGGSNVFPCDVGMSFGRPEIKPPINKSSQGLQFCSSPQKLKFQDYRDKLVVN